MTRLDTPNALYLDGRVSRLHAPGIDRSDFGFPVGPIIGIVRTSLPLTAAKAEGSRAPFRDTRHPAGLQ